MPWSEFPEQKEVLSRFELILQKCRMGHAYLLIGDSPEVLKGIATRIAQVVNCQNSSTDPCGTCESCRKIASEKHPDFYSLRPQSKSRRITIDQIRWLEGCVQLKPNLGRMKVGVLQEVDCLMEAAANAFLKTLEEPPSQTLFLLLTTRPERLLDTIRSRCLKLNIGGASLRAESEAETRIGEWLDELDRALSQRESAVLAVYQFYGRLSELLDSTRKEMEEIVKTRFDEERKARGLDETYSEKEEDELDAQVQAEYISRRLSYLKTILSHYRFLLEKNLENANPPISQNELMRRIEIIENIASQLSRNVNEALAMEVGLLKFAA